jgi:hypothetical protein
MRVHVERIGFAAALSDLCLPQYHCKRRHALKLPSIENRIPIRWGIAVRAWPPVGPNRKDRFGNVAAGQTPDRTLLPDITKAAFRGAVINPGIIARSWPRASESGAHSCKEP